jgi:hypothetical protein
MCCTICGGDICQKQFELLPKEILHNSTQK